MVRGQYKEMTASLPGGNRNWLFLVPIIIMFKFYKLIHIIKKTISYIGVERALLAMFTSLLSNLFKLYEG